MNAWWKSRVVHLCCQWHSSGHSSTEKSRLQLLLYLIWGQTLELQVRALTTRLLSSLNVLQFSPQYPQCGICKEGTPYKSSLLKFFPWFRHGRKDHLWSDPVPSDVCAPTFHPPTFFLSPTLHVPVLCEKPFLAIASTKLISFSIFFLFFSKTASYNNVSCYRKIFSLYLNFSDTVWFATQIKSHWFYASPWC